MDYEISEYKQNKLVKMDILLNAEKVDALSCIVFKDNAFTVGNKLAMKLKEVIPQHLLRFQFKLQ